MARRTSRNVLRSADGMLTRPPKSSNSPDDYQHVPTAYCHTDLERLLFKAEKPHQLVHGQNKQDHQPGEVNEGYRGIP